MYSIEKFFIGSGNSLAPNKRQAIARINYDPVNSDLDELNIRQVWTMLHILPPVARSYAYRLFCEYLRVNDLSNSHIGNIYMSVDIDVSPDISFGIPSLIACYTVYKTWVRRMKSCLRDIEFSSTNRAIAVIYHEM